MAEFSVDISGVISQLKTAETKLHGFGREIDNTEKSFQTLSSKMEGSIRKIVDGFAQMRNAAILDNPELAESAKLMNSLADSVGVKAAAAFIEATIRAEALTSAASHLGSVLKDTEATKIYNKHLMDTALAADKSVIQLEKLTNAAARITDPIVQAARQQQILNKSQEQAADLQTTYAASIAKSTTVFDQYNTEMAQQARLAEHMVQLQKVEEAERNKGEIALARARTTLESYNSKQAESLRTLERDIQVQKARDDVLTKSAVSVSRLRAEQESLMSTDARQARLLEHRTRLLMVEETERNKGEISLARARVSLESYNTQQAESLRMLERDIQVQKARDDVLTKSAVSVARLKAEQESLMSVDAQQARQLEHRTRLLMVEETERNKGEIALARARVSLESYNTKQAESLRVLEREIQVQKARDDVLTKNAISVARLKAEQESLMSVDAQQARTLAHQNDLILQKENHYRQLATQTQAYRLQLETLDSIAGRELQLNQRKVKAAQEEHKVNEQLHVQIAREKALRDPINQALALELRNKKEKRALETLELDMAQKLNTSKREQQILSQQITNGDLKEKVALETSNRARMEAIRLRERLKVVQSDEYRETVRLTQAIRAEEAAIARSTQEVRNKTKQMRVANQVAAGMRATFAGLQTSFGMFTSSTIAVATSVYAVTRALRSTLEVGTEFTAAMSRTSAIMGGIALNPEIAGAMENQVRNLAKVTQYTAVEVAGAMTELSQAGLGAGQSMMALEPTLNLAAIGQISMATAADHATNIMMIFGKEAKDLTDIVDVMATAVSSSNTTVDQLANALTYAGPAAQSAGFSFKDTVAVTEALANSGFKASRAGTGMRRLFVSLVNPTKKGKAVLDELNIAVTNLDGSSRGLIDIVEDLGSALEGMTGPEQLTKIQNLVGVYATSPIAALIAQRDALRDLRMEQDEVGGAADKMRRKIEDSLKFDYKMALSAYQEAQLHVFEQVEDKLKVLTLEAANFLNSLTVPLSEGSAVTQLDVYISRLETAGNITKNLLTGYAAVKAKTWMAEYSRALSAPDGLIQSLVAARDTARSTQLQMAMLSRSTTGAGAATTANTIATRAYAAAMGGLSVAAGAAATAVSALSRAMSVVAPWVAAIGLIYSMYDALKSAFGPSVEEKMVLQQQRVQELTEEYRRLKDASQQASIAASHKEAADQNYQARKNLSDVMKSKAEKEALREDALSLGLDTTSIDRDLAGFNNLERQLQEVVDSTSTQMNQLRTQYAVGTSNTEKFITQLKNGQLELVELDSKITEIQERGSKASKSELEDLTKLQSRRDTLHAQQLEQAAAYNASQQKVTDDIKARGSITEAVDKRLLEASDKAKAARSTEIADIDKLVEAERTRDASLSRIVELRAQALEIENATVVNKEALSKVEKELTVEMGKYEDSLVSIANTQKSLTTLTESADAALEAYRFSTLTAAEQTVELDAKLRDLAVAYQTAATAALAADKDFMQSAEGQKLYAQYVLDTVRLANQLAAINRPQRGGGSRKPEKSPEEKRLEEAIKLSQSLKKEYDKVGFAAEEYAKKVSDLKFAYEKGKITEEEYSKGLAYLHKVQQELIRSTDLNRISADKLMDTYLDNGLGKAAKDLAELNRLHKVGEISAKQHALAVSSLREKQKISGPEVGIQLSPNASFFQEAMSATIDYSQGTREWETIGNTEQADQEAARAKLDRDREMAVKAAEQTILDAEALNARKLEIQQQYNTESAALTKLGEDRKKSIMDQAAHYQKSQGMMVAASMLGSLSDMLGQFAAVGEEASAGQKAAFIASKAFAVAQILLMTEVAAMNAYHSPTDPMMVGNFTLSSLIRAQGYASAGLAAGMAIGEYSGAYDKGGYIPTGKFGLVGEIGPEFVNGPAHVTGREETARLLGKGGDSVTIAPVINVNYTSESGSETSENDAHAMANTIRAIVIDTIRDQQRPNGVLAG